MDNKRIRSDIGRARMTYLHDKCSYRRAGMMEETQRRSLAFSTSRYSVYRLGELPI
jgi:hypothetical protein